ncbi:MAG: nucleotidyltransferase domain-containing protein [Bacteroidales bacterium]|nr:nucleotidyltransferase domain-containing protein [Bacteroidales bacterium]
MERKEYKERIEEILARGGEISAADFMEVMPDVPAPTVYSRIRSLERTGRIHSVGRGIYVAGSKMKYRPEFSEKLKEICRFLIDNCEGVGYCISERGGNVYVEVSKPNIGVVIVALKEKYPRVLDLRKSKYIESELEDCIFVGPMVSEAPLDDFDGVVSSPLEKDLVDMVARKTEGPEAMAKRFQRAFEVYEVNRSALLRYASRRGVRPEVEGFLAALNHERIDLITKIQSFFATQPVERVWLFGSFARGEERPDSDVDLLVDYLESSDLSLWDIAGISLKINDYLNKEVDLIENGYLLPFAVKTADHDKFKIYERTNKRSEPVGAYNA